MNLPLTPSERVSLALRSLYQSYGYCQYKVSKFEEYDFYAQNKSFLSGEQILSFSDTNGKLMALKPDITLSIIKNTKGDERTRKLWYTENVYRVPRGGYGFSEIVQTGLECLGEVDLYATAEVLMLAAESLATISPSYVMTLSHMGLLTGLVSAFGIPDALAGQIRRSFSEKNRHALAGICREAGLKEEDVTLFGELCMLAGSADEICGRLLALDLPEASLSAARELRDICGALKAFGDYRINIDLSITSDTDYYNGVLFRGFVDGVASAVLSGGRYDQLMNRMGKRGSAIGFAVYISELELMLAEKRDHDVDVVLVYQKGTDPAALASQAKALIAQGKTVRVQPDSDPAVRYGICIRAGEGKA